MPHAEEPTPIVNGEAPYSQFFSKLEGHSVVSDSISAFKSNKYGSLTIAYADKSYSIFVSPLLPYAQTPISILSPYISRVDLLAAQGLDKADETFPIITKDTTTLKNLAYEYITLPQKKADEARIYVLDIWGQEYKANGGNGVVAGSRALLATGLTVTGDTLALLSKVLQQTRQRGETAAKEVKEKTAN